MALNEYFGLLSAIIAVTQFARWITVLREATTPWHWRQNEYKPGQYFWWGVGFLLYSILLFADVQ